MKKLLSFILMLSMLVGVCAASFSAYADDAADAVYNDLALLSDIDLSESKVIMINYWEPWCGYCVDEMPDLEALYQNYKEDGFLIVGLYHDEDGAQDVLNDTGVTYPIIHMDEYSSYTDEGFPTSLFIDKEGKILSPDIGMMAELYVEDLKALIDEYLAGGFDELRNDPGFSAFFDALDEIKGDDEKIREYARGVIEAENHSNSFVGAASYDLWERRILAVYATLN